MKKIRKSKELIKNKKLIKQLTILVGLLTIALANIVVYNLLNDEPISFSHASTMLNLRQEIRPLNPIGETFPLEKQSSKATNLKSSDYRVITEIKEENPDFLDEKTTDSEASAKNVVEPITTFSGNALYPNSRVFLEVHSQKFLTTAMSDGLGRWSWTNYGHPLEAGQHTIDMYNISPFDISGKRDIFTKKYSFTVDSSNANNQVGNIAFTDNDSVGEKEYGELGEKLMNKDVSNIYLFDSVILNKKEYSANDVIDLQLSFTNLGKSSPIDAEISYKIYTYDGNETQTVFVSEFADKIVLNGDNSFLKRINLQNEVVTGNYIMEIVVNAGGENYVQSLKFDVNAEPVVQIGNMVLTQKKFSKVLIWNIVFLLTFAIIIIVFIAGELRRFFVHGAIDENNLRKKRYFAK